MSFFVQGGVEDEQPFTGTCPTCGQTDLRAENERLRKLNDDNIKIMAAEIERLQTENERLRAFSPAPLFEKACAALEREPAPSQDSGRT